jgi:hypothetical protein
MPLFDQTTEYARLVDAIRSASGHIKKLSKATLGKTVNNLRREFEAIANQDFFPGDARRQTENLLDALTFAANQILAPGEPHVVAGRIKKLNIADYQGRIWATRKRPWIDRLASAWLIHRFIDAEARIRWLDQPVDRPKRALGFDFDGATFTHIDGKVTYEMLAASFGLDSDPALEKIGGLVHYLDVGGIPVPEAAGLEAIMRGARDRFASDDDFLAEAERVFDFIYGGYSA